MTLSADLLMLDDRDEEHEGEAEGCMESEMC